MIAVAVVLASLLMPAMRQMHENAHRVICMHNLQQIGQGFFLYSADNDDGLPYSAAIHEDDAPYDLMASRRASAVGWDGIGALYSNHYCGSAECFYCPSHKGLHPYERYADVWQLMSTNTAVFTNYHYAGDVEWNHPNRKRRSLIEGYALVLTTDGMRTKADFNHVVGMNVLRGDGSVRWREDNEDIYNRLPVEVSEETSEDFTLIWNDVADSS